MEVFVTGLHIVLCFFLLLIVLLQPGKGADFGAAMGGSSQGEIFGATGSVSLLTKITALAAALFMGTSLALAWFSNAPATGQDLSPDALQNTLGTGDEGATGAGESAPDANEAKTQDSEPTDTKAPTPNTSNADESKGENNDPQEGQQAVPPVETSGDEASSTE